MLTQENQIIEKYVRGILNNISSCFSHCSILYFSFPLSSEMPLARSQKKKTERKRPNKRQNRPPEAPIQFITAVDTITQSDNLRIASAWKRRFSMLPSPLRRRLRKAYSTGAGKKVGFAENTYLLRNFIILKFNICGNKSVFAICTQSVLSHRLFPLLTCAKYMKER